MNNENARVRIHINRKLKPYSTEWVSSLQKTIRIRLLEMHREFSESDFSSAMKRIDGQQLTLAGVTFLLSVS